MTKSYVTLEQHACEACGCAYDTGALLFDQRLRETFEHHTVTAMRGLCPECTSKRAEGFAILIAVDAARSEKEPNGNIRPSKAFRTGNVAYLREPVYERVFDVPLPEKGFVFVEPAVLDLLARSITKEGEA